ncbi:MAG: hypothetical protein SFY92_02540 [Verrucomicrobiae bacterium]|nr:hypothetical protein [Verrucomicrobiae bacterium]
MAAIKTVRRPVPQAETAPIFAADSPATGKKQAVDAGRIFCLNHTPLGRMDTQAVNEGRL